MSCSAKTWSLKEWLLLGLLAAPMAVTAQSSYEDQIEAAAQGLEVNTVEKSSASVSAEDSKADEAQPTSADSTGDAGFAEFETYLKASAPGTFRNFYRRLDDAKKSQVYQHYLGNKDVSGLRHKITQLFTQR